MKIRSKQKQYTYDLEFFTDLVKAFMRVKNELKCFEKSVHSTVFRLSSVKLKKNN